MWLVFVKLHPTFLDVKGIMKSTDEILVRQVLYPCAEGTEVVKVVSLAVEMCWCQQYSSVVAEVQIALY